MHFVHAEGYSDYHEGELPGGMARSRSLVGRIYDARRLGEWQSKLRRNPGTPPIVMHEARALGRNARTRMSLLTFAQVGMCLNRTRLDRKTVVWGKSGSSRLDPVGRRHIKKQNSVRH